MNIATHLPMKTYKFTKIDNKIYEKVCKKSKIFYNMIMYKT